MKRLLGAIALVSMLLVSGCGVNRLEPGVAAVKIDYANGGQRTDIPTGGYVTYNPVTERIAEYPVGQQTLVMVRRVGEGQNANADDSVEVRATGIPLHMDTTVFWRIDPTKVADMFQLRPNVPLIGKTVNDGIDGIVVRRLVRGAMQDVGSSYLYTDLYAAKRAEFVQAVSEQLKEQLASEYIIFDRFQLGEIYLDPAQQQAVSDYNVALQQAQTAVQTAEAVKAKADGEAYATRVSADAQAYTTLARERAMAESPHVVAYEIAIHQADHQPQVTGGQPLVQTAGR